MSCRIYCIAYCLQLLPWCKVGLIARELGMDEKRSLTEKSTLLIYLSVFAVVTVVVLSLLFKSG